MLMNAQCVSHVIRSSEFMTGTVIPKQSNVLG